MGGFQRMKRWTAIPLKPLTFLYGPNSAGKGATIDAQNLIRSLWSSSDIEPNTSHAIERWSRRKSDNLYESDVPLSVGLSCTDSPSNTLRDKFYAMAGDVYWRNSDEMPAFMGDWHPFQKGRIPGRLTWFATWDYPRQGAPTMELFHKEKRAAALLVGEYDDETTLMVRPDALEEVLGMRLADIGLFRACDGLKEHDIATDFKLATFDYFSWQLSELPTFLGGSYNQNIIADFKALLVGLFVPLPNSVRYRSEYIGPIRRVLSTEDLTFRVTRWQRRPPQTGDGSDAWASLANEVAGEYLSSAAKPTTGEHTLRLLGEVNRWLDSPQCFDSGYHITADLSLVIPTALISKAGARKNSTVAIPKDTEVIVSFSLKDRQGRQHALPDVGTGLSQIIPVIIGAFQKKNGSPAFFEQPELHLHPRLQTVLCDLFIDALNQNRKEKYGAGNMIIESHSEHLLLRLLRRIRETAKADIQHSRFSITPDDIAVLYFEPDADETFVHQLRISPDGTFADRWPKGFFDERFEEIFNE